MEKMLDVPNCYSGQHCCHPTDCAMQVVSVHTGSPCWFLHMHHNQYVIIKLVRQNQLSDNISG